MDDTALHTFLFQCPTALRSVVLVGSWDNFSKRYDLRLDTRGGRSIWKGCFTFSDIFCDGDLDMLSPKRDGPLKMGGTYWYYYEVDGDKECHNPSQPSTTLCPLLPGQAVNVLEVPRECTEEGASTEDPSAFTRNPRDRYLTPIPPGKPLPSPRPRSSHREAYTLPLPSPWAPKSATYPPTDHFLSPNVSRHARSASASPLLPSTPLFTDFRELKEKYASKRVRSRSRSSSDVREMQISAPVLISTTADGVLPICEATPPRSPMNFSRPHRTLGPPSIPAITRNFSPLASHPVEPSTYASPFIAELAANETPAQRRQSCIPTTIVSEAFDIEPGRLRANSADTRRTDCNPYANDPWVSSPSFKHEIDSEIQQAREVQFFKPAPVFRRPERSLAAPLAAERPSSSYGKHGRTAPSDTTSEEVLRIASRYSTLTPVSTFNISLPAEVTSSEQIAMEDAVTDDILQAYVDEEEPIAQISDKQRSHFSTWSSFDSYATSDDEGITSPTFSSATSVSSDAGSPMRQSMRYSYAEHSFTKTQPTTTITEIDEEEEEECAHHRTSTPPQLDLDTLRLSVVSFSSDLFNLDIQHAESMPRRQAACFGLGFKGYSLPENETKSKETIQSDVTVRPKRISVHRESSTSQLDMLMDDFSYLGDAVV